MISVLKCAATDQSHRLIVPPVYEHHLPGSRATGYDPYAPFYSLGVSSSLVVDADVAASVAAAAAAVVVAVVAGLWVAASSEVGPAGSLGPVSSPRSGFGEPAGSG